jgi:hypothetical protein
MVETHCALHSVALFLSLYVACMYVNFYISLLLLMMWIPNRR